VRNTTSGTTGSESGQEVWAFMPQEVMNKLPTLRNNAAGSGKPYLVDGAPSVYVEGRFIDQAIDGDDVHLYFGLGRGGKAYYGLDVSDPEDPSLMWKITKSGDFSELAYTTSSPVVGLRRDGSDAEPIVIFGGGYDLNKDERLGTPGDNDAEGAALYVVDGKSGELIWKAVGSGSSSSEVFVNSALVDSIASAVAALDTDGDGMTDRIYVGDTGGRIWRADIGAEDTADWTLTLLADIGRHYSATKANDRRFFHAPDVVLDKDASGPFDGVVIGSGDRSDPLDKGGVVDNFVYLIKDRNVAAGSGTNTGLDHTDFGDVTNTCLEVGAECTATLTNGWRMGLSATGEKSLATPLTVGGTVYFTTYLPPGTSSSQSCGPDEGSGRLYAVKLSNASAVRNYDTTTETLERYDELDSKGIPAEAISLPPDGILKPDLSIEKTDVPTRLRTYWLESEDGAL
jgi:type IV pilus assembly protein PilY1